MRYIFLVKGRNLYYLSSLDNIKWHGNGDEGVKSTNAKGKVPVFVEDSPCGVYKR